jgi:hypothetical protein
MSFFFLKNMSVTGALALWDNPRMAIVDLSEARQCLTDYHVW